MVCVCDPILMQFLTCCPCFCNARLFSTFSSLPLRRRRRRHRRFLRCELRATAAATVLHFPQFVCVCFFFGAPFECGAVWV